MAMVRARKQADRRKNRGREDYGNESAFHGNASVS
jgi:hypothetical protein